MTVSAELYAELGLSPEADRSTIRRAFRRLARDLHPDRNPDPGAVEAFIRVRRAYEVLTDPAHRDEIEAEAVIEAATQAAAEAMRSRTQPAGAVKPVRVPLASTVGRLSLPKVSSDLAIRMAFGWMLGGALLVLFAVMAKVWVLALAGGACVFAAVATWFVGRPAAELLIYAHQLTDGRWEEGHIGWADVCGLEANPTAGTLDLELTAEAADRLTTAEGCPRGILVWQDTRLYYRLGLGHELARVQPLVEARTGLLAQ
ncbi:MAG: J domain-containing protein [Rhodothermaceae bacterium]|nr:J domain-containing protein [Rhodothermaceae bacterium]